MLVVAGSLEPAVAVLVTHVGELGLGLLVVRIVGLVAVVPAVADMLADLGGIEILDVGEIAVVDNAGLEPAGLELASPPALGKSPMVMKSWVPPMPAQSL